MVLEKQVSELFPAETLRRHQNLLVAGPSQETVRPIPYQLLTADADQEDGAVLVTTQEIARTVLDRFTREVPAIPREHLGVVDCTKKQESAMANPRERYWSVPSPVELTKTTRSIQECLETLFEQGVSNRHLLFDSLSSQLLSAEPNLVGRFTHQVLMLAGSREALNLFPVYTNVTDESDLDQLKHLFDGMIRVRRRDGAREVLVHGIPSSPEGWVRLVDSAADRTDSRTH